MRRHNKRCKRNLHRLKLFMRKYIRRLNADFSHNKRSVGHLYNRIGFRIYRWHEMGNTVLVTIYDKRLENYYDKNVINSNLPYTKDFPDDCAKVIKDIWVYLYRQDIRLYEVYQAMNDLACDIRNVSDKSVYDKSLKE